MCLTPGIEFNPDKQNIYSIRIKVMQGRNEDGDFYAAICLTEASNLNQMQETFYDQGKRTCYGTKGDKLGDGEVIVKPSRWCENKKGKVLVFEVDLKQGLLTWKDEESGEEVYKVKNNYQEAKVFMLPEKTAQVQELLDESQYIK